MKQVWKIADDVQFTVALFLQNMYENNILLVISYWMIDSQLKRMKGECFRPSWLCRVREKVIERWDSILNWHDDNQDYIFTHYIQTFKYSLLKSGIKIAHSKKTVTLLRSKSQVFMQQNFPQLYTTINKSNMHSFENYSINEFATLTGCYFSFTNF